MRKDYIWGVYHRLNALHLFWKRERRSSEVTSPRDFLNGVVYGIGLCKASTKEYQKELKGKARPPVLP